MKYKENAVKIFPLLLAMGIVSFALMSFNILIAPLWFMVTGLTLLGFALPNFVDEILESGGHTLWTPLGIFVFSIIGFYLIFADSTFAVLVIPNWCPIPPCLPMMFVPGSLILGTFAHFAGHKLNKEKLNLM